MERERGSEKVLIINECLNKLALIHFSLRVTLPRGSARSFRQRFSRNLSPPDKEKLSPTNPNPQIFVSKSNWNCSAKVRHTNPPFPLSLSLCECLHTKFSFFVNGSFPFDPLFTQSSFSVLCVSCSVHKCWYSYCLIVPS